MGISPEEQRRFDEQKRLVEQIITDPKFLLQNVDLSPYTPFLRTNNFVQQTASRLFAYNPTEEKWTRLYTDDEGRLVLSPEVTDGAQIYLKDREFVTTTVFDGITLPGLTAATHVGIDSSGYIKKSILVSSSGAAKVHLQASPDNVSWYDMTDTSGSALNFTVSNTRMSFPNTDCNRYFRVVVENTGTTDLTLTVYVVGVT